MNKQPLKRCSQCNEHFPATSDYFWRDKQSPDGLKTWCKTCARKKQRGYYAKDPERYHEHHRVYYEKNSETIKERVSDWQKTPKARKSREKYRKKNKSKLALYFRNHYKENRAKKLRQVKDWQENNPDKRVAIRQRYAARKQSLPNDFTVEDWDFAVNYFDGRCAVCGNPPGFFHHIQADHWIPLSDPDCPGTVPHNIVPLCGGFEGCNQQKNASAPQEWLVSKYGAKKARAISNRIQRYFSLVRKT